MFAEEGEGVECGHGVAGQVGRRWGEFDFGEVKAGWENTGCVIFGIGPKVVGLGWCLWIRP